MNIIVSNLGVAANKQNLRNLFSEFGTVRSVTMSGNQQKPSGDFCWLIIDEQADAENAVSSLNNTEFMQQIIAVNSASIKASVPGGKLFL